MRNKSGITKRLYKALQNLAGKSEDIDIENALFHLCAVVESTAKKKYPKITDEKLKAIQKVESTAKKKYPKTGKERFVQYMSDSQEDLLYILSNGMRIKFDDFWNENGFWNKKKNSRISIGEILYEIRCCNYHDPEELNNYIDFENNKGGIGINKINVEYVHSLFLILISDKSNSERIDSKEFESFEKLIVNSKEHKIIDLIGKRNKLLDIHKK